MNSFTTAVYAALFMLVAISFMFLQRVILGRRKDDAEVQAMARGASRRNWLALALYGAAIPAAYVRPAISLITIVGNARLYFIPEAVGWAGGTPRRRTDRIMWS